MLEPNWEHQAMNKESPTINAQILPRAGLDILSREEITRLRDVSQGGLHDLLRRCTLAVLTTGTESDDPRAAQIRYPDYDIEVLQLDRGIKLELKNAPSSAFVDGEIMRGISDLLFAVVRDIAYTACEINTSAKFDLKTSAGITSAVFEILRNARVLRPNIDPNLVVCWGGHSIGREEYMYTKKVGYELGLRGMDICTGCGPGAMKGPMKGATIAHAKQRRHKNRYIGITEPGIIAAESPNPIVNQLVTMPDIEKRLEAFVRLGHGILVFPGGVGTAEEVLYLLGLLMHPENADISLPVILTGPTSSSAYFEQLDRFIRLSLGDAAANHYTIVVDDAVQVARLMGNGIHNVRDQRIRDKDSFFFNWSLTVPLSFQSPFEPTHSAMAGLKLHRNQPLHELAADLRRAFSGIVAGNVKDPSMKAIETHGPFLLSGDEGIMHAMDELLASFVAQRRMKISGVYQPCYRLVH
jgi:predicted Rossmann-fold nucleotide-binding protein